MKRSKLVSLVGISLLLVGCGNKTTEPSTEAKKTEAPETGLKTEIVVGASATQKPFVEAQAKEFLKANGYDKVTIKMYEVGEDKAQEITDFSAETAPDVYGYASDQTGTLYAKGALAEVPSKFSAQMVTEMGDEAANAAKLGDSYYGYPDAGANGYSLYHNKDVVSDEQAKTVESLATACAAKNLKFGYGLQTGDNSFFSIGTFMTFGARYQVSFNKDGTFKSATSDFASEKGILGAKAVRQLLTDKRVDSTKAARDAAPVEGNGFGAVVEGSWNYAKFSEALGAKMGVAKLPTITVEGQTKNLSSFLGYKLLGVNPKKSGKNVERLTLIHQLANYLVSAKVQEARFDALNTVPTQKSVKAMEKVQNNGLVKALAAQGEFAVAQTVTPANIWSGASTAVEALGKADAETKYAEIMKTYADSIAASK